MDPRERSPDGEEAMRVAIEGVLSRLWTAMPAIVQSFNPTKMVVMVQPTINGLARQKDGTTKSLQMPVLECPVLWMGGGGVTATFPIKAGDECLVIFASRCIDTWWTAGWKSGGDTTNGNTANDPFEIRRHNLSDGFALVGVRSLPRATWAIDSAAACLISDDQSTYLKLNPTTQAISGVANGGFNLNGVTIDSAGNINSPATITATTDVVGGGKSLKTHTHGGVQSGGSNTGPPV